MNPNPILREAIRRAGANYAARQIDRAAMRAIHERVERLERRWNWIQLRNQRRSGRERIFGMITRLRHEIARGGCLIAYDTEYHQAGPVTQLGIAIWHAGVVSCRTYTTASHHRRVTPASRFGRDRPATQASACALAQRLYRQDALQIFHTGGSDLTKLGLPGGHPGYIDVGIIGHGALRAKDSPGLVTLCRHYGIDPSGHHNAGNDAGLTLDVALAMAADPHWDSPSGYADMWGDDLARLTMLAPTRQPQPSEDALQALREDRLRLLHADLEIRAERNPLTL